MNTPNLPKKILMTLLSLSSLSAQAGEIWIKAGGRVLKVNVPADDGALGALKDDEVLGLLREADVRDVTTPTGTDWPSWTEPKCISVPGLGSPQAHPVMWTEKSAKDGAWTEKR